MFYDYIGVKVDEIWAEFIIIIIFIFSSDFKINQNQNFFLQSPESIIGLRHCTYCACRNLTMKEELGKQNVKGYESIIRNFKCLTLNRCKELCPPVSFCKLGNNS